MKNILITGGAGFVGGWLVRHMVSRYAQYNIICFDNLSYCSSMKNLQPVESKSNYHFFEGDITRPRNVEEAFEKYSVDTVIHLAAESHVDHSFGDPYRFTYNNTIGTHVMLESAKKYHVKRLLHMSTDEVYGEVSGKDKEVSESSILMPTNPYAASKAAADMLVGAYVKSFSLPAMIIRCNNIYGPNQFPEKVIPKFSLLLNRGRKCVLHGTGSNSRRYLYAEDAVNALDTVLHSGKIGTIYNAGTDFELTNYEVVKQLLKAYGISASDPDEVEKYIERTPDRLFNDARYAMDSTRIAELGWRPLTSFEDGLKRTVQWYKQNGDTFWGNGDSNDIDEVLKAFPSPPIKPFTLHEVGKE